MKWEFQQTGAECALLLSGTAEEIIKTMAALKLSGGDQAVAVVRAMTGPARRGTVVEQPNKFKKLTRAQAESITAWLRVPGTIDFNLSYKARYKQVVLRGAELFNVSSYQFSRLYHKVVHELEAQQGGAQ